MRGWLVLALVIAACGKDSSGGPYTPIEEITDQYQAALCTHLVACHEISDQATCLETNLYSQSFYIDPQTIQVVLEGKVRYDGGTVAACLADLAAENCRINSLDKRRTFAQCIFNVFRGSVAQGGSCASNAECISNSCNNPCGPSSATCCVGTCNPGAAPTPLAPIAIGLACPQGTGGFDPCVDGAYCDPSTQICTALKPISASCANNFECGDGLECVFGTGTSTCTSVPHLGENCAVTNTCGDEGSYCDQQTHICTAVKLVGESCATGVCSGLLSCDPSTQLCVKYPAVGMSCGVSGRCNDVGSYCNNSQVCAMPKANGMTCQSQIDCASQYCDLSTNQCAAAPTCP